MILYRSVGLHELELIYDSGMKAFPVRQPQQPIFYPVLQVEYARQVASDWNVNSGQSGGVGYVTEFRVEDAYISQLEIHTIGKSQYQELWIPSDEVDEFNKHIIGHIKVVEAHFGEVFQGFIPDTFLLAGKNAIEQFSLLANTYIYKRMDFFLELRRNHKAVFLNYLFWQTYEFKNPGLQGKIVKALKDAWFTAFPKIPLPVPPPIREEMTPTTWQTDNDVPPLEEEVIPSESKEEDNSVSLLNPVPQQVTPETNVHKPVILSLTPVEEASTGIMETDSDTNVQPPATSVRRATAPAEQAVSHFSQGVVFGLRGNYGEAIGELSKAVETNPDDVIAQTSLGVALHRMGEDDRALACFEAAIQFDPKFAEPHYFRANILYARGNVREAMAGYTTAIGLQPELIQAHQMPVPVDRLTDYIPAPAQIARIAKPAHGIMRLNQLLESNPTQVHLLKERAAEYYRLQNYEQAIADYSASLAIQPDDARALHLRGTAYEQTKQFEKAREDYQHAITLYPELANEYIERGTALGQRGNLRQAIASFTEGIRLAPQNPTGYFNRGISYLQLSEFGRATEDFSVVIQISPHDETAYYWRGIANEAAGHQSEAAADYQQVLALTNNPDVSAEVEQKLNQWHSGASSRQSVIPIEKRNTNPILSEKPDEHLDLYDLILALGEHALQSIWYGSNVDCYGERAEELYAYTDGNSPIDGEDFVRIASGLRQTIQGDFLAFNRGDTSYWVFIRAWDGTGFYVETNELQSWERLRTRFPSAEAMEGVAAPYQGLFIHI